MTPGSVASTRTIGAATGFGATEKCTWVVKSKIGAPSYMVISSTLSVDYDLYYAEYTDSVKRNYNSGSVYVDGSLSNTTG